MGSLRHCAKWWAQIKAQAAISGDSLVVDAITATGLVPLVEALPRGSRPMCQMVMACLVERWSETTYTFHLSVMEMTIAPSDIVAMTGFRREGQTIHFDVYLDRLFDVAASRAQEEALIGVPLSTRERPRYASLEAYWIQQTDFSGERLT